LSAPLTTEGRRLPVRLLVTTDGVWSVELLFCQIAWKSQVRSRVRRPSSASEAELRRMWPSLKVSP